MMTTGDHFDTYIEYPWATVRYVVSGHFDVVSVVNASRTAGHSLASVLVAVRATGLDRRCLPVFYDRFKNNAKTCQSFGCVIRLMLDQVAGSRDFAGFFPIKRYWMLLTARV
ncbi:hypothetical protein DPMN_075914 [Dreissena polymorpha]|uniref:Uncharacterized protein n=1 Tax=Dreissena polymorpha TaxID=45954 RepID=A0A9D3YMN1_DREPO|nr:hypothetical protein DPMN_075914 [Dreissena polymorpha]